MRRSSWESCRAIRVWEEELEYTNNLEGEMKCQFQRRTIVFGLRIKEGAYGPDI
jgi:hypothetical protein